MDNYVITIARGLGSGGSHIAKALSKELNIPWYDTDILHMASDLSGINEQYFFEANEKIDKGLLTIASSKGAYTGKLYDEGDKMFLSNENLFNYQAKVIRSLALSGQESCIIIGKAANYILRNFSNVLKVNVQAPMEYCVGNVMKRTSKKPEEAEKMITKTNKYRSNYYKYYTGGGWLDPREYDLSINTATISEEMAVDLIIHTLKQINSSYGQKQA